jgi:hypothetical protein
MMKTKLIAQHEQRVFLRAHHPHFGCFALFLRYKKGYHPDNQNNDPLNE